MQYYTNSSRGINYLNQSKCNGNITDYLHKLWLENELGRLFPVMKKGCLVTLVSKTSRTYGWISLLIFKDDALQYKCKWLADIHVTKVLTYKPWLNVSTVL